MKIILNGSEVEIGYSYLSYSDICQFNGCSPDTVLTVTYSKGRNKESGSLTRGQSVELSEGIVINASLTNNA